MEESMNYSTEIIKRFPQRPTDPITYVVYNEDLIPGAESLIKLIHGCDYFRKNVTVRALHEGTGQLIQASNVYFDPSVRTHRSNGYD